MCAMSEFHNMLSRRDDIELTSYPPVNEVEYGRGSALTKGEAKELAAEMALGKLQRELGQ